jgi:hypothetical protein
VAYLATQPHHVVPPEYTATYTDDDNTITTDISAIYSRVYIYRCD